MRPLLCLAMICAALPGASPEKGFRSLMPKADVAERLSAQQEGVPQLCAARRVALPEGRVGAQWSGRLAQCGLFHQRRAGDAGLADLAGSAGPLRRSRQPLRRARGQLVNEGRNADPSEGNICIQSEGWPVDYRNIEIKVLP
ncbi:MAG TPA: hypothetical protein VN442_15105 [Bryobacteraceae bacterium]|nr:hypothetical protein [Bryobacteraceae bacterium]